MSERKELMLRTSHNHDVTIVLPPGSKIEDVPQLRMLLLKAVERRYGQSSEELSRLNDLLSAGTSMIGQRFGFDSAAQDKMIGDACQLLWNWPAGSAPPF